VLGGFAAQFSLAAPVYIAAAIFVASVAWGYFYFPESLSQEHRAAHPGLAGLNPFKQLRGVFAIPQVRWLLLVTFFFAFPFAMFASMTAVLLKDSLGWNPVNIGLVYSVVGVGDILMQGILIGRLLPIFGEVKLTIGGLICEMTAYLLIGAVAFVPSTLLLWGGIACYILGSGLLEPSLGGLVSRAAGPHQQGVVQGGSQSVQSLARMLGPVGGVLLHAQVGHASPYWSGAVIVGLAIFATFLALPSIWANEPKLDASHT
jgi:DHA1 family tetracycline resistance protein-like MFS transporter